MKKIKDILCYPVIWLSLIAIANLLLFSLNFWNIGNNLVTNIGIFICFILILIGIFFDPFEKKCNRRNNKNKDDIK
ncbi:MAG: hypothetical protein RSE00_01715 [Clostridia bacterium]